MTVKKRLTVQEKENRIYRTITLNKEVWEQSGKVLEEVGFSRSRFIEMVLREVAKSQKVSFAEFTGEIFESVADAAVKKAMKKYKE